MDFGKIGGGLGCGNWGFGMWVCMCKNGREFVLFWVKKFVLLDWIAQEYSNFFRDFHLLYVYSMFLMLLMNLLTFLC